MGWTHAGCRKDSVAPECFTPRENLLVLTEKHPALEDITEDILAVQLCSLNKNGICVRTLTGLVRKCNNSLLYALPRFGNTNRYLRNHYVCLDRVYTGLPCTNVISLQPKESLYDNVLTFAHDNQYGWTDAIIEGRQFVFPSLKDKETIFEKCSLSHYFKRHYFLQEPLPRDIGEEPIRLAACYVYKIFRTYLVYKNYFIYVRSCNGKLQFDLTVINDEREFCLIAL